MIHFTSCNYLVIQNEVGQYTLRIDSNPVDDARKAIDEIDERIERLKRIRSAYSGFVSGESIQCPSALRV
jgi:hypothetical protein